ncbi:site-specific integrase [Lacibacterium aquatile]|uniref:Site-specific integrase n=1 Tax=Lacibacterium aquatile TaxID=1168082 RepID=A0ABW5DPV7_9PROT
MSEYARKQAFAENLTSKIIYDRSGLPVDISSHVWILNDPTFPMRINWRDISIPSTGILEATRQYFIHLIKMYSVGEIKGNWGALQSLWPTQVFREACESGEDIPYAAISEVRASFGKHEAYRLHYIRKWYNWCLDQGLPGFSTEVALQADELVIGGNTKGEAVRSADPNEGPLTDPEIVALQNALRAARVTNRLSLKEQVALWLCIAFGSNTGPLTLLRDEDFEKLTTDNAEGVVYQIRIPRHKKGDTTSRAQFRTRRLNAEIGALVEALVLENKKETREMEYCAYAAPLFRRSKPREDISDSSPLREFRYHYSAPLFAKEVIKQAAEQLRVISPRTGKPLHVSPRRLRYTFATRLVREGASQVVVADALDHTDLQNVQVYFDLKSDIVEKLDAAMALELGPLAQAFMGEVIKTEAQAKRAGERGSRVYFADRKTDVFDPVGSCGSFSFCGLTAPIACYTCPRFQAWIDGPHDKALQGLITLREDRVAQGYDAKFISIHDNTILAIADVIDRIDTIRSKDQSHAS